jgi:two-component system cell cycle sensor histidine kinase/response regulator CckA
VQVKIKTSATLAIEELQSASYDVIVSDYPMPEVDGTDFLERVREVNQDISVIIFSKKSLGDDVIWALDSGADYCLERDGNSTVKLSILSHYIKEGALRKQMEKKLRNSEEKYRTIFENSAIAMAIVEEDTTVALGNPEMENLTGYLRNEVEGKKSWTEFVGKEDLEKMVTLHRQRRIDPRSVPMKYEFELIDINGNSKDSIITNVMIPGTKQSLVSILDISDRKRAEGQAIAQRDLAIRLSEITSFDEALKLSLDIAIQISGMDCGGIYLFDKGSGDLILQHAIGLPSDFIKRASCYEANSDRSFLIKAGYPIYSQYQEFPLQDLDTSEGLRVVATVPIVSQDGIIGCYNVASHTAKEIPPSSHTVLETIAAQMGNVISRIQSAERIKKKQEELDSLFEFLHDFIFVLDSEGRIMRVNQLVLQRLGYSSEELIGKSALEVHPPDRHDEAAEIIARMVAGEVNLCTIPLRAKDGTLIPVETKVTQGFWADQNVLFGICRDVTERNIAEKALKESEEKYRNLVERANDGITIIQDSIVKYTNPSLAEMWGGTVEEIVGTSFSDYIKSDELSKAIDRYDRRLAGENVPPVYDTILNRKDGGIVIAELNAGVISFEGKPADLVIVRDITERKQIENALRASRESFHNIVEISAEGILILDEDGKVQFANAMAGLFFGRKPEELVGAVPGFVISLDKSAKVEIIRQNGERGIGEMRFQETMWDDKKAFLVSVHDATDRVRIEKEREHFINELETKNAEMERFVYTISHDLRSPLFSIQGFVGFLKKDIEEGERENIEIDLKMIEEAVADMDALLSDTLELSRIGRVVNSPESISFGEIVEEALKQTAEKRISRDIGISIAENWPNVLVDRMRLVEVLVNLIENSVKHMGRVIRPSIDLGYRVDGQETVFFVRDNGAGIDASQHEKVFELFYQVDKYRGGTGVGLAIAKRIIEVHNGHIWIESAKGEGCTVCFTLPVVEN